MLSFPRSLPGLSPGAGWGFNTSNHHTQQGYMPTACAAARRRPRGWSSVETTAKKKKTLQPWKGAGGEASKG